MKWKTWENAEVLTEATVHLWVIGATTIIIAFAAIWKKEWEKDGV